MTFRCTQCSGTAHEPGFLGDTGQSAPGYSRWYAGMLERGMLGGAKLWGRRKLAVEAFRCTACGHLEMYARDE